MYENAWWWLRMAENRSYSGRAVVVLSWHTFYDMRDNVWESIMRSHNAWSCMWCDCMRMTENARERLIFKEGWWVILGWHTLYDMHDNVWESIRRSHNAWSCMWWESMRRTENAWEWEIFREGWWVIRGWHTLYDMHDNEWECMRMTENAWGLLIFREGVCHSRLMCIIRHAR